MELLKEMKTGEEWQLHWLTKAKIKHTYKHAERDKEIFSYITTFINHHNHIEALSNLSGNTQGLSQN